MEVQEQMNLFLQIPEIKKIFSEQDIHWNVAEYSQGWYFEPTVPDYEKGYFLGAWETWQATKAQAVPEWNSVDDKEPPLGTMVLICWSNAPDVEPEKDYMDHDVDHGVNYWANYNDGDEPSHWMLLPEPVAQEQKG